MTGRLTLPRGRALLLDGALALVAAGAALDRLVLGWGVSTDLAGSLGWTGPLLLVPAVSLLWRRRAPIACVVGAIGPFALHAALTGHGAEGVLAVLPIDVAVYSLGAYARWPRILVGVLAAAALLTVHAVNDPGIWSQGELSWWAYLFWMLMVVVSLLLGVAVGAVRRVRQAHRDEADAEALRAEAVASERAKIARELHDSVTHNVNVVVMQAMAASGVLDSDPDRARGPLAAIESSGREALAEMRRMLGVLREDDELPLTPQPGIADIRRLADSLAGQGEPISCLVDPTLPALPEAMGIALFRIAQESLTNVMKHARGGHAEVVVRQAGDGIELEVVNAAGRAEAVRTGAGHGLIGMAERAALFGGRVEVGPLADGGFRVLARLPLEPA